MIRRELLGRTLAAGGAAALGTVGIARASGPDDPAALTSVLAVERLAVFVIANVLAGPTLGPAATELMRHILGHELVHVETLSAALRRRGRPVPPAPRSAADADRRLAALNASGRLAKLRTEADSLRLLYDIESHAIGQYYKALHTLAEASLIRLAAEMMASEAQHASAIGGMLHPGDWMRVVPAPMVKGRK
jgi:hypothetical protein